MLVAGPRASAAPPVRHSQQRARHMPERMHQRAMVRRPASLQPNRARNRADARARTPSPSPTPRVRTACARPCATRPRSPPPRGRAPGTSRAEPESASDAETAWSACRVVKWVCRERVVRCRGSVVVVRLSWQNAGQGCAGRQTRHYTTYASNDNLLNKSGRGTLRRHRFPPARACAQQPTHGLSLCVSADCSPSLRPARPHHGPYGSARVGVLYRETVDTAPDVAGDIGVRDAARLSAARWSDLACDR